MVDSMFFIVRRSFLIIVCVQLFSCSLINHKNFDAYKKQPNYNSNSPQRINGVYFLNNLSKSTIHLPKFFFMFEDGSVECGLGSNLSSIPETSFWLKPNIYLGNLKMSSVGNAGHFYTEDKIITIQFFRHTNPGGFYTTSSVELCGYIVNDSTFRLIETVCDDEYKNKIKNEEILPFKEQEFRFFKTVIKPDSSKIWFKRKRWYKKNVWYNLK